MTLFRVAVDTQRSLAVLNRLQTPEQRLGRSPILTERRLLPLSCCRVQSSIPTIGGDGFLFGSRTVTRFPSSIHRTVFFRYTFIATLP